jgi:hypothetical protein
VNRCLTLAFVVALALATAPPAQAADSGPSVRVEQQQTTATVVIGGPFSLATTVRSIADSPQRGLVAHLNILSLDPEVYVDPEDWSSQRTKYLAEVPADGSVHLTWKLHAVNAGRFVVYVALTDGRPSGSVVAGPALVVTVAKRQSLNAAGVLPTAIVVPAALLALLVFVGYRRRRRG